MLLPSLIIAATVLPRSQGWLAAVLPAASPSRIAPVSRLSLVATSSSSSSEKASTFLFTETPLDLLENPAPVTAATAATGEKAANGDSLSIPSGSFAWARAQHLTSLLVSDFMIPATSALLERGWPSSSSTSSNTDAGDKHVNNNDHTWNEFWQRSVASGSGQESLATRAASTLEAMGPTFVKFGQALASRPDVVPPSLAQALATLQDQMQPFDTAMARDVLNDEWHHPYRKDHGEDIDTILRTLSEQPVAAASIGQVYSATLACGQKVAIKVQRPGIRQVVEQDAALLLQLSAWLQSLPGMPSVSGNPPQGRRRRRRLIQTDLVGAVQEFMARLYEELDYHNEARNLQLFSLLYSHRRHRRHRQPTQTQPTPSTELPSSNIQVVVPQVYPDLCTRNVLVMEWIDGTKLVDMETEESSRESLQLIEQGIDCTLSQLLETGILHSDPHAGNLLKVVSHDEDGGPPKTRLAYVDFGLLATVPVTVRDGLVCAVAELVFERNVTAVAHLFGELALIPDSVLSNPDAMGALGEELEAALDQVLVYPTTATSTNTTTTTTTTTAATSNQQSTVPQLRFDRLINVLARLVPRFQFQLPPYFLNNARALSTLEGMAREINPQFNCLQFLYPYALKRIVANPSQNPVVEETLQHLLTDPTTGRFSRRKIRRLAHDVTRLTGYSRFQLMRDVIQSPNGPRLVRRILQDPLRNALGKKTKNGSSQTRLSQPMKRRRRVKKERASLFQL